MSNDPTWIQPFGQASPGLQQRMAQDVEEATDVDARTDLS